MKSSEDRVEERVRQRLVDRLAAAGVSEANIALEILFLLPTEFVRMYHELYDMAYGEVLRSPGGGGRDEGRIKRSGAAVGNGSQMKTRKMSGASGGGKTWSAPKDVIRREAAVDAKVRLDRKLVRAAETALTDAKKPDVREDEVGAGAISGLEPKLAKLSDSDSNRTSSSNGSGMDPSSDRSGQNRRCDQCGAFQGPSWKRCPFHP